MGIVSHLRHRDTLKMWCDALETHPKCPFLSKNDHFKIKYPLIIKYLRVGDYL